MNRLWGFAAGCMLLVCGCGENIEPQAGSTFGPPLNLRALSVNDSSVKLSWAPPAGVSASTMQRYEILFGSKTDTVVPTATSTTCTGLAKGEVSFVLAAILSDGTRSDAATIRWAPASRFDAGITLAEYYPPDATRMSGLEVGARTADPAPLIISPTVQTVMDIFLAGEGGQELQLRSAHLYLGTWNVTMFSTVSTGAASLDTSLAAFPAAGTFLLNAVTPVENTIYYVLVTGATNEHHYARIHVRGVTGSYPNRSLEVRISLQRIPGTPFAGRIGPIDPGQQSCSVRQSGPGQLAYRVQGNGPVPVTEPRHSADRVQANVTGTTV